MFIYTYFDWSHSCFADYLVNHQVTFTTIAHYQEVLPFLMSNLSGRLDFTCSKSSLLPVPRAGSGAGSAGFCVDPGNNIRHHACRHKRQYHAGESVVKPDSEVFTSVSTT